MRFDPSFYCADRRKTSGFLALVEKRRDSRMEILLEEEEVERKGRFASRPQSPSSARENQRKLALLAEVLFSFRFFRRPRTCEESVCVVGFFNA